ncbi:hypothetical protein AAON49_08095 [Pseudotenacibaculum sp. MALMAid0570]|uniref:hypothetical protein n=1 Tax=Pseudotenacibaculum sp. MALMAid0570 TaxID=3143938 RepID=UPI0032DF946C
MNDLNYVEFKKQRDLGALISDTVKFLRIEGKPFFITIIRASIIPMIIAIAGALYYTFTVAESSYLNSGNLFSSGNILLSLLGYYGTLILVNASISNSALSYIKSYAFNRGVINYEDIQETTKSKFGSVLGLSFLNAIVMAVGFMFCFLPGIYFAVVLSVSTSILMFNNLGVFDAFGDAFNFIKGNWWETFGVLLVAGLIIIVLNIILNLPAMIYQFGTDGFNFFTIENTVSATELFSDPVFLILTVLSYLINYFFHAVGVVLSALIYFDIEEQRNPSAPDIIDEIGGV